MTAEFGKAVLLGVCMIVLTTPQTTTNRVKASMIMKEIIWPYNRVDLSLDFYESR